MPGITSPASYQPADSSRPVLETTVGGVLREAAEQAAGTIALVEGTPAPGGRRRWSYADLLAASEGVARALLGRFAPGERVAVWAPNSPEWLLIEFGAALAGVTLVTVNPALRASEVAHVLGQSRTHGVVLAPAPMPSPSVTRPWAWSMRRIRYVRRPWRRAADESVADPDDLRCPLRHLQGSQCADASMP